MITSVMYLRDGRHISFYEVLELGGWLRHFSFLAKAGTDAISAVVCNTTAFPSHYRHEILASLKV